MAFPTQISGTKISNEKSAVYSIQRIQQAQVTYSSTYPAKGFACSLTALGGGPNSGQPTPAASQILQGDLASGFKSGYIFTIENCTIVSANGADRVDGYTVAAVPQTVGQTGDRGFCIDQFGAIKFDPAGGANCTQPLQ